MIDPGSEVEVVDSGPMLLWAAGAPGALGSAAGDCPTLGMYLVPGGGSRGCVVVCPGGGYSHLAAHEGEPVARWLNSLGISAGVLRYRVKPYRHPAPLADAQRALRLVRAHHREWGINPSRVGILGFSAGGHLAASAGTLFEQSAYEATDAMDSQSCRPDAMVLCYPVISFGAHRHDGSMRCLLGPEPEATWLQAMSLETRVTAQTPPAFIWHTSSDPAVPVQNSLLFAQAMAACKVPVELHVFAGVARHGVGLAQDLEDVGQWTALCAQWLRGLGFCGA